nr:uncharacterized protein LOC110381390 [Helicoverpa armigera]
MKGLLGKLIKQIPVEDKVIFIATCSNPWVARAKPMVSIFDEILLVPRTDYGSLQQYFYQKLQSIRSIPRDYNVQALAQLLQGFNFGDIIQAYEEVMTPDRIVRLNVQQLSPGEILEVLLQKDLEPLTMDEYQRYVTFFLQYSWLRTERETYDRINLFRDDMYKKQAKKEKAEQQQQQHAA